MAIELLGPDLRHLKRFSGGQFSQNTVMIIGQQMLRLVKDLHSVNYCHNDIKIDNFVVGLGSKSTSLKMIDLGFAQRYRKNSNNTHAKKV